MWMCKEINLTFLLCSISLSIYCIPPAIPYSPLVSGLLLLPSFLSCHTVMMSTFRVLMQVLHLAIQRV